MTSGTVVLTTFGILFFIDLVLVLATLLIDGYYYYAQQSLDFLHFYSIQPMVLVYVSLGYVLIFFLAIVERVCCNTYIKRRRCVYFFGFLVILLIGCLVVLAIFHIMFASDLSNCQEKFNSTDRSLTEDNLDFLAFMMAGETPTGKIDFINSLPDTLCEKPRLISILIASLMIAVLAVTIIAPCCFSADS